VQSVSVQDTWQSVQDTWQVRTDDTWQVRTGHVAVRTGHVAAPGDDTCQADLAFWAYGWTNPEGDTCHHWKGDTWHG
jgi:hypothetical protein